MASKISDINVGEFRQIVEFVNPVKEASQTGGALETGFTFLAKRFGKMRLTTGTKEISAGVYALVSQWVLDVRYDKNFWKGLQKDTRVKFLGDHYAINSMTNVEQLNTFISFTLSQEDK